MKLVFALFTGDPAGIGPELVSKLLGDPATHTRADILLIGNRAGFVGAPDVPVHPWAGLDAPAFERGVVTEKNGRFMLDALTVGARLVVEGSADALCFAPLNKGALRAGGMQHEDEMRWFAELLGHTGACGAGTFRSGRQSSGSFPGPLPKRSSAVPCRSARAMPPCSRPNRSRRLS